MLSSDPILSTSNLGSSPSFPFQRPSSNSFQPFTLPSGDWRPPRPNGPPPPPPPTSSGPTLATKSAYSTFNGQPSSTSNGPLSGTSNTLSLPRPNLPPPSKMPYLSAQSSDRRISVHSSGNRRILVDTSDKRQKNFPDAFKNSDSVEEDSGFTFSFVPSKPLSFTPEFKEAAVPEYKKMPKPIVFRSVRNK